MLLMRAQWLQRTEYAAEVDPRRLSWRRSAMAANARRVVRTVLDQICGAAKVAAVQM